MNAPGSDLDLGPKLTRRGMAGYIFYTFTRDLPSPLKQHMGLDGPEAQDF